MCLLPHGATGSPERHREQRGEKGSVSDYENGTWMSHSGFIVSKTGKPSAGVSPLENTYPPRFLLLCPS